MASKLPAFTEEDMSTDPALGYPKAYSKLCNNSRSYPYSHGPPLSFLPYTLQPQEALRAKDLNQLFPIIDPDVKSSTNPRGFVNLLWKQLDHLGNAGFDPALFRVDTFGNVLYLHADSASPLAWDIDHWFPCSRGGRTVPSNLRLIQWQVCKKKKNKLEFLVPWWDLQLGISVNQFLSIFASKNSDFRNRAFSFLFSDGGSEELNALQTVESHTFPQPFVEMKQQVGLAPAAIVSSTQRSSEAFSSSVLKPLDINKSLRHNSPFPGIKKFLPAEEEVPNISKENKRPESDDFAANPYLSITRARDSLKQREEGKKKEAEMSQLEEELNELRQRNEAERVALQDLEAVLIKRRRRVEKCRRLAEAQSSYRSLLEKMIRDAMHQSVVYKEQLRLNQAATSALMARLEAQRAICDASGNELRRKFNQRDKLERQVRPCWEEQARKRSRMDYALFEERNEDCVKGWTPLKKELRVLLEEEQRASEAGLSSLGVEEEDDDDEAIKSTKALVPAKSLIGDNDEKFLNNKLKHLAIREGSSCSKTNEIHEEGNDESRRKKPSFPQRHRNDGEDEEQRKQVGKGNVEKWLQMMLENADEGSSSPEKKESNRGEASTAETVCRLSERNPEKEEIRYLRLEKPLEERSAASTAETVCRLSEMNPEKEEIRYLRLEKPLEERSAASACRKSFDVNEREVSRGGGGGGGVASSRGFRSVPSSPSMMFGMRSEANLDSVVASNSSSKRFIKSCTRTIKRAVNK